MPKAEHIGLTPNKSTDVPRAPEIDAKAKALFGCNAPRTRGLFLVLVICESKGGSSHILYALALAQHSHVPAVRQSRVGKEAAGNGDSAYDDIVVSTTSVVSFGLESSRYVCIVGRGFDFGRANSFERVEPARHCSP